MKFLKNHPIAISALLQSTVVLTFAIEKSKIEKLIPHKLTLDTLDDKWAFLAAAFVDTRGMRPLGVPAIFGRNFILAGFRIFVRYTTSKGSKLRGLYILQSLTNSKVMSTVGNLLTQYNYTYIDIKMDEDNDNISIESKTGDFNIQAKIVTQSNGLPLNSPFNDWKVARKYAGPMPFTFYYDQKEDNILIIEGKRKEWVPIPILVNNYHIGFLENLGKENFILASAFMINNVPYTWQKGIID